MSNALPNQRLTVIGKFREQGYVTRNWALRNFISRLGAIIPDLTEEGWKIARATIDGDYHYYLINRPGRDKPDIVWPPHITDKFKRENEEIFYGKDYKGL